jgi:CAAX prenyl protease-like protein
VTDPEQEQQQDDHARHAEWLARLGDLDLARFRTGVLAFVVFGSLQSLLSATGEELGWRGFLVPTLARSLSFGGTALLSGAIWAAWHVPLILFADYNAGTPAWFSVPCFAIMVVAIAVPMAWLRLRTASVWPAAIMARRRDRRHRVDILAPARRCHAARRARGQGRHRGLAAGVGGRLALTLPPGPTGAGVARWVHSVAPGALHSGDERPAAPGMLGTA